jgi:hypothetical protein
MTDGVAVEGTGPLRLPAVLDGAQRQALAQIAVGLVGVTDLLQAVSAGRAGAPPATDALWRVAAVVDSLQAGGRAYLEAVVGRQGGSLARFDGVAPVQDWLRWLHGHDPEGLEAFASLELPWALATVLAPVAPEWVARLLSLLTDDAQDTVVILLGVMSQAAGETGGPDAAWLLALLRALPAAASERIAGSIEQLVPALGAALYQAVGAGSGLQALDDPALQRLIPRLAHRDWGRLLRHAAPALRERILANVTRRVARLLLDEMDLAPAMGLADLVAVQHRLRAAIEADGR